jgi:hypothetical protein
MGDFFLYEEPKSLSNTLCNEIIKLFHESKSKYKGITRGGLNNAIKDTTDLVIPRNGDEGDENIHEIDTWKRIERLLIKELNHNLRKYFTKCTIILKERTGENIMHNDEKHAISNFQIQKYNKNEGKYIYHDDSEINYDNRMTRKLTFIWYLNDVEEGGETEIVGIIKVKPQIGKLFIFPATWTYLHSGKMPISHDKYIITGWVYSPGPNY